MDNREQQKNPGEANELGNWVPEDWMPETQHDQSKIGESAMRHSAITSAPDNETSSLPSANEAFEIIGGPTEEPVSQPAKDKSDESMPLIFDPTDIAPKEEGLSVSAETAIHSIQDLIVRGDNPKDGYANYQALRKIINGGPGK